MKSAYPPYELLMFTVMITNVTFAQIERDTMETKIERPWKWTGYLETYLTAGRPDPIAKRHPAFQYSYHKLGGVQLNLGMVEFGYEGSRFRGHWGVGTGTYIDRNLSSEPAGWKNITQANIGVALDRQQRWWIDAGIFPSHIGVESAQGAPCINLTRSIVADNSPYYESGLRLSGRNKSERIQFQLLLLNGWQRIQFSPQRQSLAVGHQFVFQPHATWLINSSGFWGESSPGIQRMYHNLYIQWQPNSSWRMLIGWDIGSQQQAGKRIGWQAPMFQGQWSWNSAWRWGMRLEYFTDPHAAILPTSNGNSFQGWSSSTNLDWKINQQLMWRIEYRTFKNKSPYFEHAEGLQRQYSSATTALIYAL